MIGKEGQKMKQQISSSESISFSVVTSVLNGAEYIKECLLSVSSQSKFRIQHIVIDAGSQDGTIEIVEKFKADNPAQNILLILAPGTTLYQALNIGLEKAENEVFSYLNADDWYLPGSFSTVASELLSSTENEVIYFDDLVAVDGWLYRNSPQPASYINKRLKFGHILYQESVFARTKMIKDVGGFSNELKLAGDFELWLRLAKKCSFKKGAGHVAVFAIRKGQLSEDTLGYFSEMAQTLIRSSLLIKSIFSEKLLVALIKAYNKKRINVSTSKYPNPKRIAKAIDSWNIHNASWSSFGEKIPTQEYFTGEFFPKCPIGNETLNNFAFTTSDTRFPSAEISHLFFCPEHIVFSCSPDISLPTLSSLYEKHYSSGSSISLDHDISSPFKFYGSDSNRRKIIGRLPLERFFAKFYPYIWRENTVNEVIELVESSGFSKNDDLRFLDLGCFEGNHLIEFKKHTNWSLIGMDNNSNAVNKGLSLGLEIYHGNIEDLDASCFNELKFDVILLSQSIEHVLNPLQLLKSLCFLLEPNGIVIVSTPNLHSKQTVLFGPTWSSWHTPYHRNIFSRQALEALGLRAGFSLVGSKTFSNCYWSALSFAINAQGVLGNVNHNTSMPEGVIRLSYRMGLMANLFWNRAGFGENLYVILKPSKELRK
jgi:glycosyltransferase involved in cell wall biosynthesis